jgi:hypothetical protein
MVSQTTVEAWRALSDTADLLARLALVPPQERAAMARKTVLRNCLVLRKMLDGDHSSETREVLKDAQFTLLHIRQTKKPPQPN